MLLKKKRNRLIQKIEITFVLERKKIGTEKKRRGRMGEMGGTITRLIAIYSQGEGA